jgi:hypothetical protein
MILQRNEWNRIVSDDSMERRSVSEVGRDSVKPF